MSLGAIVVLPEGPARGQGNGLRTFDRVLLLESASATSASVSIGDLDANGTLDKECREERKSKFLSPSQVV